MTGTAGFDRVGHDGRHVDRLFLEPDLAAGDSGNLEQVIDQVSHLANLVVDHVAGPAQVGVVRAALLHDLDGVADRGQGVAQLVAQHGQELVLARVCLGQLARLRLAVPQGRLRPLSLGDFPLVVLDIAGCRRPHEERLQSQRRGPARNRRQQRHSTRAIDLSLTDRAGKLRQAAEDQKCAQQPNAPSRGNRAIRAPLRY